MTPNLCYYETLDSTNEEAKRMARQGACHGTVIIAGEQTAGKGRLGRSFYSPKDTGIYLSILLRPTGCPEDPLCITSAAAVAVYRAILEVTGQRTQIKWVNDVYFQNKKICGILAESVIRENRFDAVVVGIGINVSTTQFPGELTQTAGSLYTPRKDQLTLAVIHHFMDLYKNLDQKTFLPDYIENSMVIGKQVLLIRQDQSQRATVLSINDSGHLMVRLENGEESEISTGEISLRLDEAHE